MTCVTPVSVQSLPTSVRVNWTAVVPSAGAAASDVVSGTNPEGGAIFVETSQAPSATMTNGYFSCSSVHSMYSGCTRLRYEPKNSVCDPGTIFPLKVAMSDSGTFAV